MRFTDDIEVMYGVGGMRGSTDAARTATGSAVHWVEYFHISP